MLIVQKYGGTSLQDAERIQAAAKRVAGLAQQGARVFEKLFSFCRRKLCLLDLASSAKARIHSRKQEAEAAQLLY